MDLSVYPNSPDALKLIQWIGFCRMYGADLDARQEEIAAMSDNVFKSFEETEYNLDKAYAFIAYFNNMEIEQAEAMYKVGAAFGIYNEFYNKMFSIELPIVPAMKYKWQDKTWLLPPVELLPSSKVTFGEFIDSKIVVQNAAARSHNKWQLLHQIAAIFLRQPGEEYRDEFINDDNSERLQLIGDISIRMALEVGEWFERFNKYLHENFTIFRDSVVKSGQYTSLHFKNWGWVNFLVSIAKTKVFDIPNSGLNSIECARRASCFDVLMYASQEKDYADAMYADMEAANKK